MFVITPHFHGHLTVDSLFIFQNFVNFTGPLTISHHPSFMKHLAFGQNDCPTINLNTDLHVDKFDWYCGSIEGVGHFNVSQLNFYSNGTKTLDITSNFTVFDEIITDSSQTLFFIKTSLHFPQDVEVRCAPNSDFKIYYLNEHDSFLYNIASMSFDCEHIFINLTFNQNNIVNLGNYSSMIVLNQPHFNGFLMFPKLLVWSFLTLKPYLLILSIVL
ncbi:hypothetical protein GEMRC1_005979 [Eukaryota sp. GEM-RC1]